MNFEPLKNTRVLDAALGKPIDKIPVWMMRQVGRYLPAYRELRAKHSYFEFCETPELVAEATLLPLRYFELDAAIIFSDMLVVPRAMGFDIQVSAGQGAHATRYLTKPEDIDELLAYPVNVDEKLKYVYDAITLTRWLLHGTVPLLGFAGAPWTLMCYMTGGKATNAKRAAAKYWLYKYPQASHKLLDAIQEVVIDHLVGQIVAGAQMVQLFELDLEFLSKPLFEKFCLPRCRNISASVRAKLKRKGVDEVPMVIFAKGGHYALKELAESGYEVISLDWTVDPEEARKIVGPSVTLQGNLDPCALYASCKDVTLATIDMVSRFGADRYIANLGHGILKDVEPEKVKTFVNTVHLLYNNKDVK